MDEKKKYTFFNKHFLSAYLIILIGFPYSGKSTLGPLLAESYKLKFIHTIKDSGNFF